MTRERASEILKLYEWQASGCWVARTPRPKIAAETPEEAEEIGETWRQMDGSTCRYDAVAQIAKRGYTPDPLFAGVFPCGIAYADKRREKHGDWMKVAFLPYSSLELEIRDPASDLLPRIRKDAAKIQARRGEPFEIDSCGQTVVLGE